MSICGVYAIENTVNGKIYIGQSVNLGKRLNEHKYCLGRRTHKNIHLQNAWNKYGEANFTFRIIEVCSERDLDQKEIFHINKCRKVAKLYNIKGGGANGRLSEETKEKIRVANTGRPGTMTGKTHSEESKIKISKAGKGRKMSEKNKQILIALSTGRTMPEETRKKIREARKHQVITEETRKKLSKAFTGRKFGPPTEETKEKLRQANLGKKLTEETKRKIGQASLGHKLNEKAKRKLSEERKGQNGPMAKLTDEQVYIIKTMVSQGHQGKAIAQMFGVSQQTICDIKHGRCWNHIAVEQIKETIEAV